MKKINKLIVLESYKERTPTALENFFNNLCPSKKRRNNAGLLQTKWYSYMHLL